MIYTWVTTERASQGHTQKSCRNALCWHKVVHIPTSAAAVFETPLDLGEEISVGSLHLVCAAIYNPLEVIFWIFKQRNDDAGDFWFF